MKYRIVLLFCSSLFFLSCKNGTNKNDIEVVATKASDANAVDEHNSQNSLDWSGTYSGVVPCADCEGIETEIILNKDMTFIRRTKYLGKGDQKVAEEIGSFVWDKTGSIVSLKGIDEAPGQYKVGENKLMQLDMEGKVITGSLADNYILKK
ncbi:copper resistance protein NlpE [Flavobacterium sp. W1B]|uniref:copper resistance protein NlpE n=1 Tax=Flavobacterium sp. W1B TaxID=3394146 RepID=UPI0039BCE8E8